MKKALIFCLSILLCLAMAVPVYAGYEYHANMSIYAKKYTYEGHNYSLLDYSNYNIGTTELASSNRGPYEIAELGIVKTTWSGDYDIVSAPLYYGNVISQVVKYSEPGDYTITLSGLWRKGPLIGRTSSTTHNVTVRPCPYLDWYQFTGDKRPCRKQTFEFSLAQNPEYPIQNLNIQIPGAFLGDLNYEADETGEFVNGSLEFLTKNETAQTFTLILTAIDSRNKIYTKEIKFDMGIDQAPFASINGNTYYYRDKETKLAEASLSAAKKNSDDKQVYSWKLTGSRGEEYSGKDQSLGLNMEMKYMLPLVGRYNVELTVKDTWDKTELGSLAKYITESDYKTATAVKTIVVDNIAPKVSLGEIEEVQKEPTPVNILIIGECANQASFEKALIEKNIKPTITVVPAPEDKPAGSLVRQATLTSTYYRALSQASGDSAFYKQAVYADDNYIYRILGEAKSNTIINPYVLKYDLNNLDAAPVQIAIDDPQSFASQFVNEFTEDITGSVPDGYYPIYDSTGKVNYKYKIKQTGTQNKNASIEVTPINGTTAVTAGISNNKSGFIGYALELGDGRIVIGLGQDVNATSSTKNTKVSTCGNVVYTNYKNGSAESEFTTPATFSHGFKHKDTVLLFDAYDTTTTIQVYKFSKGYDAQVEELKNQYLQGEGLNIALDLKTESLSAETVMSKLGLSDETTGSGGSGSAKGNTFTFSYYDQEGDPFLKAKYEYNGITYTSDSLTITIDKVPGVNTLKFWAMDDTGNAAYNKWSSPVVINIEDSEETETGEEITPPAKCFKLFRCY